MPDFWLIARHEYRKMVSTRTFKATTIGLPLLMVAVFGIFVLVDLMGRNETPIGYVDHAGLISPDVRPINQKDLLILHAFAEETAAEAALARGDIQAFFVIPAAYPQSPQIVQYYWDETPGSNVYQTMNAYLRAGLVADMPAEVQARLTEDSTITLRSADGRRQVEGRGIIDVLLPLAAAFLLFFAIIGTAGYLLQVVADEKENRTMEIMITSISPLALIGGKALGLMAVSLTQIMLWGVTLVGAMIVGANYFDALPTVTVPWLLILVILLFFLPTYGLAAGIMIAIGVGLSEVRQGQQIAAVVNLLFVFPFFLTILFFIDPNSPIVVAMTLFPTTSFVAITMRWGLTVIPIWQLLAAWLLLTSSTLFSIWAAARIFRAGMLNYGQALSLKAILAALRTQ